MTLSSYLISFALTLAVEIPVAFLFGFRDRKSILCIVLVNLVTHPALGWLLWINENWELFKLNYATILFIETTIALAESLLLCYSLRIKAKSALLISFSMNVTSFLAGILIASI